MRGRRGARSALALLVTVSALGATPAPAAAAEPVRYLDPVFSGVTVTRDLPYGSAPDFGGRMQVLDLDLYQPTGDTLARRPVIILAFGGGFWTGDKASMAGLATAYAERGFVAASITYRLDEAGGPLRFPVDGAGINRVIAAKRDMQAAVRWLRSQAITYRLDPGKVSVGGYSAGAVTAAMAAVMPDDPGTSGTPGLSSSVCTAVVIAGGGGGNLAGPGDAGAIFFHGTADPVVPYVLAQATEASMRQAGLPTSLVTYPGASHGIFASQAADIEERSSAWLEAQAVDRPTSCAGPVDPHADAFATAAHHDLLGRAPTADELARMVNLLDSGASRGMVLTDLTMSDEWLGSIVTGFYADTLGRAPDAEGLEFWVGALRSGRFSVAEVAASFYASAEYRDGRVEGWITDMYDEILGRAPADDDLVYWGRQVELNGPSWVAGRIYGSLESRRARVTALYEHLLGRSPEPDGLDFWSARVATAGDLSSARSLAASPEYRSLAIVRFP